MEALAGNFTAIVIYKDLILGRRHFGGQSGDGTFDNVFTNTTVQISSVPRHLDIDDAIQDPIDFFNNHRKLQRGETQEIRHTSE
jgi:hypothetical protein